MTAQGMLDSEANLVVLCSIGTSHFAIPAGRVQEIIRTPMIRRVHHSPAFLLGVFNLRGRIVELIDPEKRLDLNEPSDPESHRIMVLNAGESIVGILVHSVVGVFPYTETAMKPAPESLPMRQREMISGFLKLDDSMAGLLNIDALLEIPKDEKAMPTTSSQHP